MASVFHVSDLKIHRIVEFEFRYKPALEMLPALTPDILAANRSWLQPDSLDPDDVFKLSIQSFVIETPHHTILIDSCVGNDKHRNMPEFHMRSDNSYLRALSSAGFSVEDIDYVLCTHLHVDHVGWNTRRQDGEWVPTFPNARYVFGKEEHAFWEAANAKQENPIYLDSVLPIVQKGRASLVNSDFQLGDHVRILPTPGHTVGHFAFCFGKDRDDVVVTGDIMHVPLQLRYPELSFLNDFNPIQAAVTRRSFLDRYCDTQTVCCMAHFPSPSSGRIRRWDDGFKCEPV